LNWQELFAFHVSPLELFIRGMATYWLLLMLDRLSFSVPLVRKLLDPPPLVLVKNGRINWRNMRREAITKEELQGHIRQNGPTEIAEAGRVCMESDGKVSVIPLKKSLAKPGSSKVPGAR
jgi:uncharacterized membrane protein YcaP (DUF421 family)